MNKNLTVFMGRLIIPPGTEEIRSRAYERNRRIRSVIVPGSVKTIGSRAFADCTNLTDITLCEGIETIEANAFTGCTNLKSIRLPASIRNITGWAFYGSGLQKAVLDASGRILIFCPSAAAGTEYIVPSGVQEIGMQAFAELHNLQRVILPQGLQIIRERAFIACGLESISLPGGIKLIESGAFYHCRKLKEITGLPNSNPVEYAEEFLRIQGERLAAPFGSDQPKTRHWEEPGFRAIAGRCAKGDASAMYEMMQYFHQMAPQYPDTVFYARAENFWLYRAYQYGNQKAARILEKWVVDHPGQKLRILPLSSRLSGTLEGSFLNAIGFPDFEEDREYGLCGVDAEGLVLVNAYESEDGPDEDGFGREAYYDWWFFDDCLNAIPEAPYLHSYSTNELSGATAKKKLAEMHERAVQLKRAKTEHREKQN